MSVAVDSFDAHVAQGLVARERGDLPTAISAFRRACQVSPDHAGARCELAFTLQRAGERAEAGEHYRRALDLDPVNMGALAGLARLARESGDPAAALSLLEEAARHTEPLPHGLQCDRADLLRELGRDEEALELLRATVATDATQWRAWVGLALLARERGEPAKAAALFREAARQAPEHTGVQLELGLSQRQMGLLDEAVQTYRALLAREPTQLEARLGLAACQRQQGHLEAAVETLRAAVMQVPDDVAARVELGTLLRESSRLPEATAQYAAAIAVQPTHWPARVGLALAARTRGEHAESVEQFTQALQSNPGHRGLRAELALSLRLVQRFEEAEAMYRGLSEEDPSDAGPLQGLSQIALARADVAGASRWAEAAGEAARADVGIQLWLSSVYRDTGHYVEAARVSDRMLAEHPERAEVWLERGLLCRARKDRLAALAAFEHAAVLKSERGSIEAAVEQIAMGKPEAARATYETVLARNPGDVAAELGLVEVDLLAADYTRVAVRCRRLVHAYPKLAAPYRPLCRALVHLDRAEEATQLVRELQYRLPNINEADAIRLEILRTCGLKPEVDVLLRQPRVSGTREFPLWLEQVLARLTFFDLEGVERALQDPPAQRPYEHSRVHYVRGLLADLKWQVGPAIEAFHHALSMFPEDAGAHHHLARLYLLQADADRTRIHLRASLKHNSSAISLRGESMNASQNLLGQLLNELQLEPDLARELKRLNELAPSSRIEPLKSIVRERGRLTPPAICLLLAMRQSGAFTQPARSLASTGEPKIPKRIMQYWDQSSPPNDIVRLMEGWAVAHPDYEYRRFDHRSAREYLAEHYQPEVLNAYRRAGHPAQACDIFRLAYLNREGGYYIDADDRCVGHLSTIAGSDAEFVGYQEQYATVGNNFLASAPNLELVNKVFVDAVETLNRGDTDSIWLATGPGLLTRAIASACAATPSAVQQFTRKYNLCDRGEMMGATWMHVITHYKSVGRGWSGTKH